MKDIYQDLDIFFQVGVTHTKINWVLSLSNGSKFEIFGAGSMTRIFPCKYYWMYIFYHKRHNIWYYMVTKPGEMVKCPPEGSNIDVSMDSVHK